MCREIELGLSRKHNIGYIEGDLLKISREANDWHKERHIYGLDVFRQLELKVGNALELIRKNPHPNLMRIERYDFDWVWVEYIDGVILDNRSQFTPRIDQERPSFFDKHADNAGNMVKVLQGIYEGVKHLHKIGVAHTDITGFNIMVDKKGNAKIIDLLGAMPLTKQFEELDNKLLLRVYESILAEPKMTKLEYRIWEKKIKNTKTK